MKKAIIIFVSTALVIAIIVTAVTVFSRLGYFQGGGDLRITGTAVDGVFYYEVPHKGIYKYTPDKGSEQILWKYWYDEYTVNDYAVYYTSGDTIYCIPHGTNESKKLYKQAGEKNIGISPCGDNIIAYFENEFAYVMLDGRTGKRLYTVLDYDKDEVNVNYSLGNRTLSVTKENKKYIIRENGKSILRENETLSLPIPADYVYLEGCLVFEMSDESLSDDSNREYLILRPDGRDSRITVNPEEGEGISGGDKNYLFDQRFDNNIVCIDAYTGKTWDIAKDKVFMYKSVVAADTDYLYITEYSDYDEPLSCYKIIYDSDKNPESLKLVNDNILQ